MSDFFEGAPPLPDEDDYAADDGALFGRIAELSDEELDDEARCEALGAAQVLHNTNGMEAGGLLMMPEPEQHHHSDATGVA